MTADLHIHTTASDGRLTPHDIYKQAKLANLSFIAITDHDTIESVLELQNLPTSGVSIIPGVEFNTDIPGCEVHILGYGIDIHNSQLINQLDKLAQDRTLRARKMVDKLTSLGFPIDYDHVLQIAGNSKAIGRPHIAKALIEKNYFQSMDEVFSTLLDCNGPAYVAHYRLTPEEAIQLVQAAGGIAVLAHPGLIGSDEVVFKLIQSGIDGLEIYHPKHTQTQTEAYKALAHRYNLKISGGSDFHGIPGYFPEKLGQFTIPACLAEKLMNGQA